VFEYSTSHAAAEANNSAGTNVTATLAPYPDLQVVNLRTEPATGLQSGSAVTLRWDDGNTGVAAVGGAFYDRITVKNAGTQEVLATVTLLYDPAAPGTGAIPADGSRARQYTLTPPDGPPAAGTIEFTVVPEVLGRVVEYNGGGTGETNNTTVIPRASALAAYPDVQAVNLQVDPPAGVQSGTSVVVRWDDTNTGNRATGASW